MAMVPSPNPGDAPAKLKAFQDRVARAKSALRRADPEDNPEAYEALSLTVSALLELGQVYEKLVREGASAAAMSAVDLAASRSAAESIREATRYKELVEAVVEACGTAASVAQALGGS